MYSCQHIWRRYPSNTTNRAVEKLLMKLRRQREVSFSIVYKCENCEEFLNREKHFGHRHPWDVMTIGLPILFAPKKWIKSINIGGK